MRTIIAGITDINTAISASGFNPTAIISRESVKYQNVFNLIVPRDKWKRCYGERNLELIENADAIICNINERQLIGLSRMRGLRIYIHTI